MSRNTQTLSLQEHFTEFEDGERYKQKRARCNYCASSLAKKNVKRHQAHLISCDVFKQRHPEQWQNFCQYVQGLPSRESRVPQTPQQLAEAQLVMSQPLPQRQPVQQQPVTQMQHAQMQQDQLQAQHSFDWQQTTPAPGTLTFTDSTLNNRIGWGHRPALLLLDVCTAYWTLGSPLDTSHHSGSVTAPDCMRRLVSISRNARIPVIWTHTSYKRGLRDAGLHALKSPAISVFEEGDERNLNLWLPRLQPLESEDVVSKTHPSAFHGTTLSGRLRFMGVDTLVICGASTSGAVKSTALDAMCENYRPMIVGQACADRTAEQHDSGILEMDANSADVVTEDEAVAHLRKGWHF